MHPQFFHRRLLSTGGLALFGILLLGELSAQPFTVQGPGVNTGDFRVTTFATNLDFPLGMARLSDGSLLVSISQGANYSSSVGKLVRFTDTNLDGIADGAGTALYTNVTGSLTDLRVVDGLVFMMSRQFPLTVLRAGALPSSPLTLVGRFGIAYTNNRSHAASAIEVRRSPGFTNHYDVLFQLGAEGNNTATVGTLAITNSNIPGATGNVAGDAIHMLTLIDNGATLTATNLIQIASGVRNPAGLAFHPVTGGLFFEDNGIDTTGSNEPTSADELNLIARTNVGGAVDFFGFPANYSAYRTATTVGGAGLQPLVAFRPIPLPATGKKSEGPNDIAIAPPGFPNGLNTGIFIGFHGIYNSAGTANDENALVYADPTTGAYFHFILGQQAGIGHLDGLLTTRDSLFVADLVKTGNPSSGAGAGVIYQIKSLVTPSPPVLTARRVGAQIELSWDRGTLQEADTATGVWKDVAEAFSPQSVPAAGPRKFFRTRY